MTLAIGGTAPDFEAETTEGRIRFHDWIGESWAVLFSYPRDFAAVSTTELGYMAKIKPDFERRGVKVIGLSVDSSPDHERWADDIEETQGARPGYPIIADADFNVSNLYGMLPASSSRDAGNRTPEDNETVRNVFVIGPDKTIKLILMYPVTTGRNFDEVLRVIDSLQLTSKYKVSTPVNWKQGDDVVIAGSVNNEQAKELFGEWRSPKPYIRIVPEPEGETSPSAELRDPITIRERPQPRIDQGAEPPPREQRVDRDAHRPRERFLRARAARHLKVNGVLHLKSWIALHEGTRLTASMRDFDVPPGGLRLLLIVSAPGFNFHEADRQLIAVPPDADSEVANFELVPNEVGDLDLRVEAWTANMSTRLGLLSLTVSVGLGDVAADERDASRPMATTADATGVMSLRIEPHGHRYRYMFVLNDVAYDDVGDPIEPSEWEEVLRILNRVGELASRNAKHSNAEATRLLRNQGMQLWRTLVPTKVKEWFWSSRDQIRYLNVFARESPVPWELLYPFDPQREDRGFLVEQFPVVRRVLRTDPPRALPRQPARFVMPPKSPPLAQEEIIRVRVLLDGGTEEMNATVTGKDALCELLDSGDFGVLHFACHNAFEADENTLSIRFDTDSRFSILDLEGVRSGRALEGHTPLIFMNACRSAQPVRTFARMDGWADAFLDAGAGAFVGSHWSVRDSSALGFAEVFYSEFASGRRLGDAALEARKAIRSQPSDSTWLAYTVFGDALATISPMLET